MQCAMLAGCVSGCENELRNLLLTRAGIRTFIFSFTSQPWIFALPCTSQVAMYVLDSPQVRPALWADADVDVEGEVLGRLAELRVSIKEPYRLQGL